jgi:hypothetical protein
VKKWKMSERIVSQRTRDSHNTKTQ